MRMVCSIVLGLVIAACGPPSRGTVREYPGTLRAPASFAGDFVLDQTVTAIHAQGRESFRAVLEKRGDALTMVGLAPSGTRAFVLTQRGTEVSYESAMPRELPFPPRYMLLDVHRAWLMGIDGAPLSDGEHRAERDGEEIVETWADGRLLSRTYRRLDGAPPGAIVIRYEGGLSPDRSAPPPSQVELDNGWFGYRLLITGIGLRPL